MAKVKSSGVIDIWKKKKWHRILAPKVFNEQVIGDTPSLEPGMVMERTVVVNLMHLTRDMKKQNMNVCFEVNKVLGDTAYTSVKSFEINPSSIKRFVRRGKQRIDDSVVCKTADNRKIRIKPIYVTLNSVKGSIGNAIRLKSREIIKEKVNKIQSDVLIQEIVNHKFQKDIKDVLNKVYPLRVCEIRKLVFDKITKTGESQAEAVQEEKSEEKEAKTEKKEGKDKKEDSDKKAEAKTEKKQEKEAVEEKEEVKQEKEKKDSAENKEQKKRKI